MDKKILSIFILLLILISVTILFISLKESSPQEETEDYSTGEYPTDDDIYIKIDDIFLSEDDEINIGEMV